MSLTHQSNGRAQPLSRSWNRVIAEIGMEKGDWSLSLRPWWRIKEAAADDDNPGIENYIGRGELLITRAMGHHVLTLRGRHSLKGGAESRGSAQLDWAFPIGSGVHGYLQLFTGYGESMIDYNIKQTKLGVGISLVEWR
ncbi:MAG: phospholipase A [Burkholderiales bacterium]|nr:phospholipase A [Burkholderiales bacterium]